MNLSKLLKNFMGPKQQAAPSPAPPPVPQNYNLSENYYPKEAFESPRPSPPQPNTQLAPNFAPDSSPSAPQPQTQQIPSGAGLDIQSLLPLLAGMNGGGSGSGLNIASLLGGNKSSGGSANPLSLVSSILGGNKKDDKDVDLNKNSQHLVENFKKISDLDD